MMTVDRNPVPSREQVLSVVWALLQRAKDDSELDHAACAKYAELLLKRGTDQPSKSIDPSLQAEIEKVIKANP